MTTLMKCGRLTICDGEVVTFATGFSGERGVFGESYRATGNFEVSASRNAVVVHRAECREASDVGLLVDAIMLAHRAMADLVSKRGTDRFFPRDPAPCVVPVDAAAA